MQSLYIFSEAYSNGFRVEILGIFSLASIIFGILVIISKNPIVSVLCLIGLFLSIACYLIMMGISFIGLAYLLVYVGAVSILFLFILMLINVRISELQSETSNSVPLAIIASMCFIYAIHATLPDSLELLSSHTVSFHNAFNYVWSFIHSNYYFKNFFNFFFIYSSGETALVTSSSWDLNLGETSHITSIGNIMYTSYSIWLIITSLILLLAMVGAIVITIPKPNAFTSLFSQSSLFVRNSTPFKDGRCNTYKTKTLKALGVSQQRGMIGNGASSAAAGSLLITAGAFGIFMAIFGMTYHFIQMGVTPEGTSGIEQELWSWNTIRDDLIEDFDHHNGSFGGIYREILGMRDFRQVTHWIDDGLGNIGQWRRCLYSLGVHGHNVMELNAGRFHFAYHSLTEIYDITMGYYESLVLIEFHSDIAPLDEVSPEGIEARRLVQQEVYDILNKIRRNLDFITNEINAGRGGSHPLYDL